MAAQSGRKWKMERASVNKADKNRPRSNKYSSGDSSRKPAAGERSQVWVGGYTKQDGTKVEGYYRSL